MAAIQADHLPNLPHSYPLEQGFDFVLYGDSLTQCLRNWGHNCVGASDWFNGNWGRNYTAANWALGGE